MKDYLQRHESGEEKPSRVGGVHGPAVMRVPTRAWGCRARPVYRNPGRGATWENLPPGTVKFFHLWTPTTSSPLGRTWGYKYLCLSFLCCLISCSHWMNPQEAREKGKSMMQSGKGQLPEANSMVEREGWTRANKISTTVSDAALPIMVKCWKPPICPTLGNSWTT